MEIQALNCPNCGSPVFRHDRFCSYCGSGIRIVEDDNHLMRVELVHAGPVRVLKASATIDSVAATAAEKNVDKNIVAMFIRKEFCRKFVEDMFDCIDIKDGYDFDIDTMSRYYEATVRIVEPDYRFERGMPDFESPYRNS